MAGHHLIDTYLAALAHRLPPSVVDELADGLDETFRHHLDRGLAPTAAATAATAEFGNPDAVTAAFARHSPGRRTAIALLATAPIFAALWGTTLITGRAWTWNIPPAAAVAFGATLLAVVATLVTVVTSRSYRRASLTGLACVALVLLDAAMLAAVMSSAPALTWIVVVAGSASIIRIVMSARIVPRILTQ